MITNKDLSIDSENGKITLNGNKYDLGTQGEIDTAVKDVYSVMGQMGAKNLIPRPYADGEYKSYSNITYTVNTDGTITATATQTLTDDTTFYLYGPTDTEELVLKAGVTYVLSGDPDASGAERIVVTGRSTTGGTSEMLILNNTGVPKEYTPDVDKVITSIYIRNYTSTTTPYNKTFKPMLRLATDTDNTYQPYAKTNKELTEVIGDLSQTGLTGDSVAAQLEAVGDQLEELTGNTLTGINISAYNADTNQYTTPTDGYVRMELRDANQYFYLNVNNTTLLGGEGHTVTNANDYICAFIRKGMRIYYTGTVQTAIFYSLT